MAFFLVHRIQYRLKYLCRAIQYFATVFLVLFVIYLYHGKHDHTAAGTIVQTLQGDSVLPGVLPTGKLNVTCSANTFLSSKGCVPCPRGSFSFPGWSECQPWLDCTDISLQVVASKRLAGYTKAIWLADWKGHPVIFVNCSLRSLRSKWYSTRCSQGIQRIEKLQGFFVTRLIGICRENFKMVTAYYKHGSPKQLEKLLQQPQFSHYNNIQTRFRLSVEYVKIMNYLHTSPMGVRVMCDTASIGKTLSQYLITDDFHLIVNDLDNLPEVKREEGELIICSRLKELRPFVAPEQRWPNQSIPFRRGVMPAYDEKIDIWKIPAVVESFLDAVEGSTFAKSQLRQMMERCHTIDPAQRPTANEVPQELLRVQQLIDEKRYVGI